VLSFRIPSLVGFVKRVRFLEGIADQAGKYRIHVGCMMGPFLRAEVVKVLVAERQNCSETVWRLF